MKGSCCDRHYWCGCEECSRWHGSRPFFGRVLIAILFLVGGIGALVYSGQMADYIRQFGVTGGARTFVVIGAILEIIGAILIGIGLYTRLGTYLLMLVLACWTLIAHRFWNFDGIGYQVEAIQFFKNLAIFGGLLLLSIYGPGRWSVDACLSKHCRLHRQKEEEVRKNP